MRQKSHMRHVELLKKINENIDKNKHKMGNIEKLDDYYDAHLHDESTILSLKGMLK